MTDGVFSAGGILNPTYDIDFDEPASLTRTMSQPLVVDNPVGLVIFGDNSAIYLAHIPDPGSEPYGALPIVKANIYIHGWAVNAGTLYVLDGVELSSWDLLRGTQTKTINLITDADDFEAATLRLKKLKEAIQCAEWATMLEQAEDELGRITAEQSAAAAGSAERTKLDALATDFLKMLKELRGVTGAGDNPRGFIQSLRDLLVDVRKDAAPYLFSAPVIRKSSVQEPLRAIFVMQGNGTLHYFDKPLNHKGSKKWHDKAEAQLLLVEKPTSTMLAYNSEGTLYLADAASLDEISKWKSPAVSAGETLTLASSSGRIWWATPTDIYVLELNASNDLQLAWKTGKPYSTQQVGRHPIPPTPYEPPVNPNDLFETMNVRAWIAKRPNQAADLNPGMMAHLLLSNDNGKYTAPPEGKSFILALPWTSQEASSWHDLKLHPRSPLVLLSDSRGLQIQCRYPFSLGSQNQKLVPHWATGSWVFTTAQGSPNDQRLSQVWPTPNVRVLTPPEPDMAAKFVAANIDPPSMSDLLRNVPGGNLTDRHLRYIIWFAKLRWDSSYVPIPWQSGAHGSLKPSGAPSWLVKRFNMGGAWPPSSQFPGVFSIPGQDEAKQSFRSSKVAVNFDPPWTWPKEGPPTDLFHSTPPAWYDPWGFNRPGDFETSQPGPTYLQPFSFDGQLKFPVRPVTLDVPKGRIWSVFTDNDPASILASLPEPDEKAIKEKKTVDDDPVLAQASAEPDTLVMITDQYLHLTIVQLLPSKPLRITHDAKSHRIQHEVPALGLTHSVVSAPPVVFLNPKKLFPVAWCPVHTDSASTRLRKLAAFDSQISDVPWDQWVKANKAEHGPDSQQTRWKIATCPLPSVALPSVMLHGYGLPPK